MVIVRRLAIGLLLTLSAAGSAQNAAEPPLVPLPARMELQAGAPFEIGAATAISVSSADPAAVRVSRELTELIRRSTGRTLSTPSPATTNRIDIALDAARQALGTEGYELTIDAQRVALTAASPAGLFYGLQTIRQLLPAISEYEAVCSSSRAVRSSRRSASSIRRASPGAPRCSTSPATSSRRTTSSGTST